MTRSRLTLLAAVCLLQTLFFARFRDLPTRVVSDNVRYEEAGWQLATQHRLALPFVMMPDEVVRGWVCVRHPDACGSDGYSPSAAYPPGYSVFLGAVYSVFGRSLGVVVLAQFLLLMLLFVMFEAVAHRLLPPAGYWFCMALAATYTFIAPQASVIMSDHLHVVLLFGALATFVLMRPSPVRGAVFAALFAAATLVRPYSIVCVPFVFFWPGLWRGQNAARREWLVAVAVVAVPFVAWALRNFYWFGRFIPLTTTGLGAPLYTLMMEWRLGGVYEPSQSIALQAALGQYGDPMTWSANHLLARDAIAWLHGHVLQTFFMLALHLPKVWISLGTEGQGISHAALLIVPYLGGLWLLGLMGMWLARRDDKFKLLMALILPYWAFVLPWFEARRTLPLRLPLLLFAGVAFARLYRWAQSRRQQ